MRIGTLLTHFRISPRLLLVGLLSLLLVTWISHIETHEGEQHASDTPLSVRQQSNSISGVGETYELTIAYSDVKADDILPLRLFLANLETNKPIVGADLTLTMSGPGVERTIKPTATDSPGEYRAEIKVNADVTYSFLVEVSTKESSDLFSIDDFKLVIASPPSPVTSQQSALKWTNYLLYLATGIAMIVGLVFYQLSRRKYARPNNEVLTDTRKETS
jgi:hypothetical protein